LAQPHIPISAPSLNGKEEAYLLDAFRSSWISSSGAYVNRFETEFASLIGTEYAASVANGTVALHLALLALGVGPGQEVIVPALTYVATANAVRYCGAEPIFVDVDPRTWCIDPGALDDAISSKTAGIIVVHLYGHPADMDAINAVASERRLWVVEDAAEAHFSTYKGQTVGRLSTIATFSFYGNKVITSGEGGALTYSGAELDRRIRMLRSQGTDPKQRYYHPIIGYNYRLTNLACALLCAQLERRNALVERRRHIFDLYRRRLANIPGIDQQPVANWATISPWLFCVTVDKSRFGLSRDELAAALATRGIETRPFFYPLHLMPPYQGGNRNRAGKFPVAERLGSTGINLPTFVDLSDDMIEKVCAVIDEMAAG
jgi:perosamine synthetase